MINYFDRNIYCSVSKLRMFSYIEKAKSTITISTGNALKRSIFQNSNKLYDKNAL